MGWKPLPRYDESRNQWTITFKKHKRFLCTGKDNQFEAYRKAETILGQSLIEGRPTTVAELIAAWLKGSGNEQYRWWAERWNKDMGGNKLEQITPRTLEKYAETLKDDGCSSRSIRAYIWAAHRILKWAHLRGFVLEIPAKPPLAKAQKRYRNVEQVVLESAFEKIPDRSRPIIEFILATGCRPSEACKLRWVEVDENAGHCILEKHKTAEVTAFARVIYLSAEALEILKPLPRVGEYVFLSRYKKPYTPNGIRCILRKVGINGGYRLRHTFAQRLRESGIPLDVIQVLLGHRLLSTTQIYCHVTNLLAVQAVQALPPLLPGKPADNLNQSNGVA